MEDMGLVRTGFDHNSDGDVVRHGHTDQSGSETELNHTRFLGFFDIVATRPGDASSGDIGPDCSFTTTIVSVVSFFSRQECRQRAHGVDECGQGLEYTV